MTSPFRLDLRFPLFGAFCVAITLPAACAATGEHPFDADERRAGDVDAQASGPSPDLASEGENSEVDGDDAGLPVFVEQDADVDPFEADPPPPWCGPGTTPKPSDPGGTLTCPDDKNLPGCACPEAKHGQTAPCFTGKRKNRRRGICKDGTTTCVRVGESTYAWGDCLGQVLPKPAAKTGREACQCFSQGRWKIDNLVPCIVSSGPPDGGTVTYAAVSTEQDPNDPAQSKCPEVGGTLPLPMPTSGHWSSGTLQADCAGRFKLCYRLRAGDVKNPLPTDCLIGESCTEVDYAVENQVMNFPPLPHWVSNDSTCIERYATVGGYGEMVVSGQSWQCEALTERVFNRVGYCPLRCSEEPQLPECAQCGSGSAGTF